MGSFINQLRRELETLWEKCYISDDERNRFTPYFTNSYTEEVFELHDQEVKRLSNLYNLNPEIYNLIDRRQELWQNMTDMEDKANDTNRLFGNRDGSLLQEEKERKRVRNELPRVEKTLKEAILGWELLNDKPFLVHGQVLEDFITSTWEHYNEMKRKEIIERKEAKSRQVELESRLGTKNVSLNNSKLPSGPSCPRTSNRLRNSSIINRSHLPAATPSPKQSRSHMHSSLRSSPARNTAFKAPRRISAVKGIPKHSKNTSPLVSTRPPVSKRRTSIQMLSAKNTSRLISPTTRNLSSNLSASKAKRRTSNQMLSAKNTSRLNSTSSRNISFLI